MSKIRGVSPFHSPSCFELCSSVNLAFTPLQPVTCLSQFPDFTGCGATITAVQDNGFHLLQISNISAASAQALTALPVFVMKSLSSLSSLDGLRPPAVPNVERIVGDVLPGARVKGFPHWV